MIVGFPPFFGDSPTETCKKIMNWKQNLKFPSDCQITEDAKDLIRRLVTDVDKRIGYNSTREIKEHAFFKGIDWEYLKKTEPMFIPDVNSQLDTRYFDKFEEEEEFYPSKSEVSKQVSKDICFVDFDFERCEKERLSLVSMLENEEFIKSTVKGMSKKEKEGKFLSKVSIVNVNSSLNRKKEGESTELNMVSDDQFESHVERSELYKNASESSIFKSKNNVCMMKNLNKQSSISIKVSI